MSISRATERSVLSQDQIEMVGRTHHPAIYSLDSKALRDLQVQLRSERSKVQTQVRERIREARGKGKPRGRKFPGETDRPLVRKQALSNALKRVNKELERHRKLEAKSEHVEAAHRALALLRAGNFHSAPPDDRTSHDGMQPSPNTKRRRIIPGSQIGSVSQQTKNAQAKKDNRDKTT
ncbi:MAG: hypothetical protein J0H65_07535 [Rhizobiales bacterium]|nr:hypothetical protein [Hyphomicrobiales bacterium]